MDNLPSQLAGLAISKVQIGDLQLTVAVADTGAARARGLMGVADLGSLNGLLFAYPAPTDTSFYMKDVPIPLDIAFASDDGTVIAVLTMPICEGTPCPTYRSPETFRWAVETPAGGLGGVEAGDRFAVTP